MRILDVFIVSALKELGHDPFLALPENRLQDLKIIMLELVRLKKKENAR